MPDVCHGGEGGPLEGETEGGLVGGDWDVEGSCFLTLCMVLAGFLGLRLIPAYLCAPDAECYCATSTIANFLSEQCRVRVILAPSVSDPVSGVHLIQSYAH